MITNYSYRARANIEDAERALTFRDAKALDYALTRLFELSQMVRADTKSIRDQLLVDYTFIWNRTRRKYTRLRLTQAQAAALQDIWTLQIGLLQKLKGADDKLLTQVLQRMKERESQTIKSLAVAR